MFGNIRRISVLLILATAIGACSDAGMTPAEIADHATRYTAAWNSGDPAAVSMLFSENGSLKVNNAEPAVGREAITEVARGFMTAFPDMELQMRDLKVTDDSVEYQWRYLGTNTGPGGTGAAVDFNGYEEWTFGPDKLVVRSLGHFDEDEYRAQLNMPRPLTPGSSDADIVAHMMQHEKNQTQTDALAINFPDLTREHAYAIQRLRLVQTASNSNPLVGWKLGWTRMAEPNEVLDPVVGHYLQSRVYTPGQPVSTRFFTAGTAAAEPEIVFYLNKDLTGPTATREEVIEAIDSVGIAMEFVGSRNADLSNREHAIVDNGIAAGVVLGDRRFDVRDLDFTQIEGSVTVNSAETSTGKATSIMGKDPIEGLLWAANELPKYGMHLSAGQFIISGTVTRPLPVSAGDSATVAFTRMGLLSATFVE
jgi:2-keto-4-pentenoate hydratase/nuclear transport factor 2 (NTF2) superfamily protein